MPPFGSILDVLEALQGLVDKSLAQRDAGAGGGTAAELRFAMLETIREFALERLARGGEEADVRAREHAATYLELAQTGEPHLRGPAQLVWLARLEREHDNLRAALEWLEQRGQVEAALRLGGALWRFWMMRGYLSEGHARLAGLLARAEGVAGGAGRVDPAAHAEALLGAGVLAIFQGDLDVARSLQERALPLWREAGDELGVAYARFMLGNIAYSRGDLAAARPLLEEGLAAQRAAGDRRGVAWVAGALGRTLGAAGEYDAARPLIEERLAICRELGDRLGVSLALWFLAELAFDRGDAEGAAALRREALELCRELDDRTYVAPAAGGLRRGRRGRRGPGTGPAPGRRRGGAARGRRHPTHVARAGPPEPLAGAGGGGGG